MSLAPERVQASDAALVRRPRGLFLDAPAPVGQLLLPGARAPSFAAWPEGNRSVVLPDVTLPHRGGSWLLSVKGVGARQGMWGPDSERPGTTRTFSAECWFGEAPWGAQGDEGVATALAVTEEAHGDSLFGLPLCPLLAAVALPPDLPVAPATYRGYRGGWWQEHRLVPSRVRLGDQADLTLAFDPEAALGVLGVGTVGALDAFLERLLATGLAALTLAARSALPGPAGVTAFTFAHVWLDKDAVVAPDGALCFADLEGLERVPVAGPEALFAVARRQLDDHVYELLYAVDRLLDLGERWRDRPLSPAARRRDLALRTELALAGDPWIEALPRADGLDLRLRPPAWPERPLLLPFLHA